MKEKLSLRSDWLLYVAYYFQMKGKKNHLIEILCIHMTKDKQRQTFIKISWKIQKCLIGMQKYTGLIFYTVTSYINKL